MKFKNRGFRSCIVFFAMIMGKNIFADGSFFIYNNSLYSLKLVVTTTDTFGNEITSQSPVIAPAPTNQNGTLQIHGDDSYYAASASVPVGTFNEVKFVGSAKDFNVQILNSADTVVSQINVGKTVGAVIDNDSARVVYVYSNVDSNGQAVANSGGAVYYWDRNLTLQSPMVQVFAK
jgi:hypothetical protein